MLDKDGNSGAAIEFDYVTSTGYSQNAFGNGNIDISMHRSGDEYKWLDLLQIQFTQPTDDQFLNCMTAPSYTEADKEKSNMFRRLSFVQAHYVKDVLMKALNEEFVNGRIPSDEEIKQILANARAPKSPVVIENPSVEGVFILDGVINTETFPWDSLSSNEKTVKFVIVPAVRNGNGDIFCVGEEVKHQGADDTAYIEKFVLDQDNNDIIAYTTKGIANVQFLLKLPVTEKVAS